MDYHEKIKELLNVTESIDLVMSSYNIVEYNLEFSELLKHNNSDIVEELALIHSFIEYARDFLGKNGIEQYDLYVDSNCYEQTFYRYDMIWDLLFVFKESSTKVDKLIESLEEYASYELKLTNYDVNSVTVEEFNSKRRRYKYTKLI